MTCPPYDDLSAYADHMLKPRDQERFAAHFAGCPVCRLRLDEISALRQSLGALPSPALGFDLGARLEDRLRAGSVRRRPQPFWSNWARRLGGGGDGFRRLAWRFADRRWRAARKHGARVRSGAARWTVRRC